MAYSHVYLSPHFDDAALSCGGLAHRQASHGEHVLVVTIFTARPDYDDLGPFAQELHALWGNQADILETRQQEDLQAMRTLGADYVRLGYLDALYRRERSSGELLYPNNDALFGPPDHHDLSLPQELAEAIVELLPLDNLAQERDGLRLYAPLAIGGHVDHRLVSAAARLLSEAGFRVSFYEDFPYVEKAGELEKALAGQSGGSWQSWPLDEEDIRARIQAVNCYASQLDALWRDGVPPEQHIRAYCSGLLHGQSAWPPPDSSAPENYAERYWQLK